MDTAVAEAMRKRQRAINFELARTAYRKKTRTYAENSFYHIPGMTADDMEQELLTVLWTAVQAYDPGRGRTFNTFVQMLWRNKIGSLRREAGAQRRTAEIVSLDVEAIRIAIDHRRSEPSAEDEALARELARLEWDATPLKIRERIAG